MTIGVAAASATAESSTSIRAVTAPRAAGLVSVVVRNPDGQQGTLTGAFRYLAAPAITGLNVVKGCALGGTTVRISGSGFLAGAIATFDGLPATPVSVTAGAVTIRTPRTPWGP